MSGRAVAIAIAAGLALLVRSAHGGPDAGAPDAERGSLDDDTPDETPDAALAPELAGLVGAAASFDASRAAPIGFDHMHHDRQVEIAGHDPVACRACHDLTDDGRPRGRPDHRACFGACHGPAPARARTLVVPAAQVRLCSACHAGAALAARAAGSATPLTVAYPPYTIDRDWALVLSHKVHASDCASCHRGATPPHTRCLGCHRARPAPGAPVAGAAPPIGACTLCHTPGFGPVAGPSLIPGPIALTGFAHDRHRAVAPAATCTACHAAIAQTDGITLPPPTTASCATAGCHDGRAAFATTAACTRCHTLAAPTTYEVPRPTARYSHADHAGRLDDAACATCHALDAGGRARPPDHAACVGCHAADFAAIAPTICGACHVAVEPWRHLLPDRPPPATTEFGARLAHASHPGPCATCHVASAATGELAPAAGHAACAGACHGATGPAPHLADCAGCHALGLSAARERDRRAAPWSVRARFRHAPHLAAPSTCATCHGGLDRATSIEAIPPPKKAACAPCHDGAVAFKLTGTGCVRCHGPQP